MAQKDKIKELVGRGLNSYHTKSLQQIDRIEKKNKEQNHKISILSNELDNDYLTKTEEGSVVSLEHSKEGMVYLDELQGNTLVNYCANGSKEMTLNGDIDIEGNFVTTTEGVDDGLVDIMCEGNTLVNAWTLTETPYNPNISSNLTSKVTVDQSKSYCKITINENLSGVEGNKWIVFRAYPKQHCRDMIRLSTTYTLIFNLDYNFDLNSNIKISVADNISNHFVKDKGFMPKKGLNKVVVTTVSEEPENRTKQHIYLGFPNFLATDMIGKYFKFSDFYMLEGDWTNKEIPPYFKDMKSVGQDDENRHKIEILSRNKNLIRKEYFPSLILNGNHDGMTFTTLEDGSVIAKGTPTKSITQFCNFNYATILKHGVRYNAKDIGIQITKFDGTKQYGGFVFDKNTMQKVEVYFQWNKVGEVYDEHRYPMFAEDTVYTSDYIQGKINKKEILMNEPLRKANDFYRDRLVKIGNKCYIERNTKEVVLDGTHNVAISSTSVKNETLCRFDFTINGLIKGSNGGEDKKFICDKLPYLFIHALAGGSTNVTQECISNHSTNENSLNMVIKKSRLETIDVTGVNKWLSNNNIKIIIPIATPIYEPLEIEPTLNAYNDITHISNNSLIPCNMKIQNSGYNVIIKPSTLYTVALDTNKSGTIGMNLGGTKVTTTNNVATITTPATLTDDSLRIYGKGIKGSKIRLLEGDKTNWIPSHFEGMKSSFEDKVQEDGSYKMEILMNNENLFDITKLQGDSTEHHIAKKNNANGFTLTRKNTGSGWNYSTWELPFKLKANTKYTISCKINKSNINSKPCCRLFDFTLQKEYAMLYSSGKYEFTTPINGYERIKLLLYSSIDNVTINEGDTVDFNDIKISEVKNGDFVNHQSNKIQFSSIEPLRKWDRFVFKDGQLMIERRTLEKVLTKDMSWSLNATVVSRNSTQFVCYTLPEWGCSPSSEEILCDKKPTKNINDGNNSIWVYNKATLVLQMRYDTIKTVEDLKAWLDSERPSVQLPLTEPTYEEIPFELQKIILEGYENGTLFFDTNIPPTSTTTYAGETPIVKSVKLNKTEVLNNTNDINDNIIPYLMDMDYRVVCLQLQSEEFNGGVAMARLFGGAYEMLKRDIQSKRYSTEEYRHRLDAYLGANKITHEEYNKLGDMLNE